MKKITLDDSRSTPNEPAGNLKVWKKPHLNQLDIKQTLVGHPSSPTATGEPQPLGAPPKE